MKRLYILRHAKSSWAQPGLGDMDRRLNKRGKRQLATLQDWFSRQSTKPDVALCSPSERTRLTWQGLEQALPGTVFEIASSLYSGSVDTYLAELSARNEDRVMMIGHNPTCDELARYLMAPTSPAANSLISAHFGTANLAIFDLEIDEWNSISGGSGQLVTMLRPRDLIQEG